MEEETPYRLGAPLRLGLSGAKGVGKTYTALKLHEIVWFLTEKTEAVREYSFGEALKRAAACLTGRVPMSECQFDRSKTVLLEATFRFESFDRLLDCMLEVIWGPAGPTDDLLNQRLGMNRAKVHSSILAGLEKIAVVCEDSIQWHESPMFFGRLLQLLGTEVIRDHVCHDFWARVVRHRLEQEKPRHWVVSDVRFPDEARAVREMGGRVFRVVGPAIELADGRPMTHVSENALAGFELPELVNGRTGNYRLHLIKNVLMR